MEHSKDPRTVLAQSAAGNTEATDTLMGILYDELHRRAANQLKRERSDHTLQPTALVNEVYLRLLRPAEIDYQGRTHFLALASTAMRRILIEYARKHRPARNMTLDGFPGKESPRENIDIRSLADSLDDLAKIDPRATRVVELRFFGGLTEAEIARKLEVSERTVRADWALAKAWLRSRLAGDDDDGRAEVSKA